MSAPVVVGAGSPCESPGFGDRLGGRSSFDPQGVVVVCFARSVGSVGQRGAGARWGTVPGRTVLVPVFVLV